LNKTAGLPVEIEEVKKAIYYARKYHGEQMRKSGEPYYSHPIEVAYIISDYLFKTDVIVASILHDTIEDTEITASMISDLFGWRVAEMVDRLTRDRPDGSKLSVEEIMKNAYHKADKEVLLIKIIDKLHNIQNMQFIQAKKQISTAQETLDAILPMCTYLEDINMELKIGNITNSILNYKSEGDLLRHKISNKLLDSRRNHFVDLFKS
jgi:(p)ppGpp synthase/HD superfamily hydrolase